MADVVRSIGPIRIDCCSETLYTLSFEPSMFVIVPENEQYKALYQACDCEVLASHNAVRFEMKNLDMGILTVFYNPQIQTADFSVSESLEKIAKAIISSGIYY